MTRSTQPKKARCTQCGSGMRNRTLDGVKLTTQSDICVNCDAENIINSTYSAVKGN